MLSSISNAIAKKFAPTSEIVKQFDTVNSESAELDRKIEIKKTQLQEAGRADPTSVQRIAGELNALEAQRKSNETAAAALQSGLEASKAAEKAAGRAKERAELLRRVETDKAFMTGMYQQLAKQMLPGLKHLAETERLVFAFNLENETGEAHVTSAETALRRQPSQKLWLDPLSQAVNLPQVDPADEPLHRALTRDELQAEAIGRDAAQRIATRKRVTAVNPPGQRRTA
jgi:hypothetical protein